ncbi:hypothetical protein NT04LS_2859, partial [Listeria seeligeri FSL S4-171]
IYDKIDTLTDLKKSAFCFAGLFTEEVFRYQDRTDKR